jgi:hypothetical protein
VRTQPTTSSVSVSAQARKAPALERHPLELGLRSFCSPSREASPFRRIASRRTQGDELMHACIGPLVAKALVHG